MTPRLWAWHLEEWCYHQLELGKTLGGTEVWGKIRNLVWDEFEI